jgi:hypothetical protein
MTFSEGPLDASGIPSESPRPPRTAYCEYSRNVIPPVDPSDVVQPRFMKDLGIVAGRCIDWFDGNLSRYEANPHRANHLQSLSRGFKGLLCVLT